MPRIYLLRFEELLNVFLEQRAKSFDDNYGGFGQAPKFPQAPTLQLLSQIATSNENASAMLEKTLSKMAFGTIFDHVAGGFHRYATDQAWLVPHFEKMLYDNALLAPLYAGRSKRNDNFRKVAVETLDYMYRDLASPNGGFYCAEDADSGDIEGGFYLYTTEEVTAYFGENKAAAIINAANIKPKGNFTVDERIHALEAQAGYTSIKYPNVIYGEQLCIPELKKIRDQRPRPFRDEKILASWNGMALSGIAQCYKSMGRAEELKNAQDLKKYFEEHIFLPNGGIRHLSLQTSQNRPELLEDYVWTIDGFLELHDIELDASILAKILKLQERQQDLFWDKEKNFYKLSSRRDERLRFETYDFYDHAIPSNTSQGLENLLRIFALTGDLKWKDIYDKLKGTCLPLAVQSPYATASIVRVIDLESKFRIIHIYHDDLKAAQEMALAFFQNARISQSITTVFHRTESYSCEVCTLTHCELKSDFKEVLKFVETHL